jgi:hypothetical protein
VTLQAGGGGGQAYRGNAQTARGYAALVTAGAAAGQSDSPESSPATTETFIKQLPDLTGLKSEVIIQSHRNPRPPTPPQE